MKSNLSEDFYNLTTQLMMAREKREIMNIVGEFLSTIDKLVEVEKNGSGLRPKVKADSYILKFTKKDIQDMAKTFKKEFIANGLAAHVIKRESGKNSWCYEIRYRSNGYNITASSTNLAEAKKKFLEKTTKSEIGKYYTHKNTYLSSFPFTFNSFALYYFEMFRKEKVTEKTFKNDLNRYNKHLKPHFLEKEIKKITPSDCKAILDKVKKQGKGKTADELYSLMNAIFNSAITHKIIDVNPLATVLHIQHDREEGEALSVEAEQKLIAVLPTSDCAVELALCLFCGLRPNEMENKINPPAIEGDFIKAVNSKRHFKDKNKIEFKYIPICDRLKPFIKDGINIQHTAKIARRRLQEILPENTLKDLRTTFYTKCQIFNVAENALKEFMGHSFGKLGNAYSDLTKHKAYLLSEGEKLNQW